MMPNGETCKPYKFGNIKVQKKAKKWRILNGLTFGMEYYVKFTSETLSETCRGLIFGLTALRRGVSPNLQP